MCFSVTASFTASLVLITCGVAALKHAQEKRLRMIAAIPLIFGLQQFAEGMVWLSFVDPRFLFVRMTAAYIFLACAGELWPLWIPIAIARFAGNYKPYIPSIVAGVLCALMSNVYALLYPISVVAGCNMIYYFDVAQIAYPALHYYTGIAMSVLYVIATIVPFFLTRNKMLWFIGTLIAVAYIIAYVAYREAFASVWCFFAALISILVYVCIRDENLQRA